MSSNNALQPMPLRVTAELGSSVRCLARLLAALAVLSVWITFPLGQPMSVPADSPPRDAQSDGQRVALAIDAEGCPADGDAGFHGMAFPISAAARTMARRVAA